MKRFVLPLFCVVLMLSFTGCGGVAVSARGYDEVSGYVLDNLDTLTSTKEIEFFDYETIRSAAGGVYYGYYYSSTNEIAVPDFYSGENLGEEYEADGGTYFGKPNNGTDWCYVKKITDNWYYYELHWA